MSEIPKVNPCNECWQPVTASPTPIGDQYSCENCHGGEPGGYDLSQWNDENPLTEKPLSKANPEPLPKCWCGAEWELTESEISYEHPSTECDLSGIRFFKNQIRFLFNPEIIKKLVSERDDLQAQLDAIPSERFTSPVAYENLARRYALACRIIRAFTDIVLEHDD